MKKIRVLLADDHPVVRAGIRALLSSAPDIEVVAEAKSGAEALAQVAELQPAVLLLDMEMPDISGVEVAKKLKAEHSAVRVLALSAYDDAQYVKSLLESGAAGYITKEEAPEMIINAVRGVAQGQEGWVSRRAVATMSAWTRQGSSEHNPLTDRERMVLSLIVEGNTNQEIGTRLNISEKTVEKHVTAILSKLGVGSRVEAAVQAIQRKLVSTA